MTALLGVIGVAISLWAAVVVMWVRALRAYLSRAASPRQATVSPAPARGF